MSAALASDLPPDVVELVAWRPPATITPLREVAFRKNGWLPDEVERLRAMFAADKSFDEIAGAIGRPRGGVATKVLELGLRRNSALPWSELDDAELARRYGQEATAAIAQDLGRGVTSCYTRARLLGLTEQNEPRWTEWEDAQLTAAYAQGVPMSQICALIGRSLGGVQTRASKLALRHANHPKDWSQAECDRALELAEQGLRYRFIRQRMADEGYPERSKASFDQRILKLGCGRGWGRLWTDDEDELLTRAYREGSGLTLLRYRMGRSAGSLRYRAEFLGLRGTHPSPNGFRQGPDWSDEHKARLREAYGNVRSKDLAAELGRGLYAMLQKANAMGLVHGLFNPPNAEEIEFLQAAWLRPVSLYEVAIALGRKYAALAKWTSNHGPRFNDPGRPVKSPRGPGRARLTTREAILAVPAVTPPPPGMRSCGFAPDDRADLGHGGAGDAERPRAGTDLAGPDRQRHPRRVLRHPRPRSKRAARRELRRFRAGAEGRGAGHGA